MNWITTNIRFPEDLYMELKMEAAQKRKSVAQVIRERISTSKSNHKKGTTQNSLSELNKFATEMAQKNKGINLTKALREMRYEQ